MDIFDVVLSLSTLTLLEIVLGIDNLIFLTIVVQKLPPYQQRLGRQIGLTFAWMTRLLLLLAAVYLTKLTQPLLTIFDFKLTGRDLFLVTGGIFLIIKATQEIHSEIECAKKKLPNKQVKKISFTAVIIQIATLDIVFSLDSILTAVGLTKEYVIMAIAITIAIIIMIFASNPLARFIGKHPTIKMLALSFLILIGTILVADGCHFHIPRGYIYFSLAFSMFVEILNLVYRNRKIKQF